VKDVPARRAVFATAGHVDHGKTALVRALTGTDTDRLPEEKRRGISIELGFAELGEDRISFIDVPGHRKLVHAMIAGASGVDALVLVVAADDGVMPQTREHLHVARLLGVHRVLVALTKSDLVDAETLALAEADVRGALAELGLEPFDVVHTSVQTGLGLDALRSALRRLARSLPALAETARAWLPIDRVFSVKGAGTVVTGTLTRGRLAVGQAVSVHTGAGALGSTCRGLEVHGRAVDRVGAPTRVAVNLGKLGKDDVRRGDVLAVEPVLPIARGMDVVLHAAPGAERELRSGSPAVIHIGTARASARITFLADGLAHLSLEEPLVCIGGVGFVLRGFASDRSRGAVIGGGRVLDADAPPVPPPRDRTARERRERMLAFARDGRLRDAGVVMVDLGAPRPVEGERVESRLGVEPGVTQEWFATDQSPDGVVSVGNGRTWTSVRAQRDLTRMAVDLTLMHQTRAPHEPGVSVETLRAALAERAGRDAADAAIDRAVAAGELVLQSQGLACTPAFGATQQARSEGDAGHVLEVITLARLEGPSDAEVTARGGLSADATRAALTRLSAEARARRLGGLWFAESALAELRGALREYFRGQGALTMAGFKELAGVSRKQAIPLLEQLDREGSTKRSGDVRLAGSELRE
jgi:selenocysteine-specific elongation factor